LNLAASLADTPVAGGNGGSHEAFDDFCIGGGRLARRGNCHAAVALGCNEPTGMISLQELYAAAGVNNLPTQEFEDQSVVFSATTKR
jgi:hypothetical protein